MTHKYQLGDKVITPSGHVGEIRSILIRDVSDFQFLAGVLYVAGGGDSEHTIHESAIVLADKSKPEPKPSRIVDARIGEIATFDWCGRPMIGRVTSATTDGNRFISFDVKFYSPGLGRVIRNTFPAESIKFTF